MTETAQVIGLHDRLGRCPLKMRIVHMLDKQFYIHTRIRNKILIHCIHAEGCKVAKLIVNYGAVRCGRFI